MSPIPSPTPLRRKLGRLLFSPAGLLFGFVMLLIVTCPGARGDDLATTASAGRPGFAAGTVRPTFDLTKPLAAPPAARPFARSTRFDRGAASASRAVGTENRSGGSIETFRHSRAVLPLLVDPLIGGGSSTSATTIRPMTGPAVGITDRRALSR